MTNGRRVSRCRAVCTATSSAVGKSAVGTRVAVTGSGAVGSGAGACCEVDGVDDGVEEVEEVGEFMVTGYTMESTPKTPSLLDLWYFENPKIWFRGWRGGGARTLVFCFSVL
jgi:hypothetical protein